MYFEIPAIGEPHGVFAKDNYQEKLQIASRDLRGLLVPGASNLTAVEFVGSEFTIIEGAASETSLAAQNDLELTPEQIRESIIEINSSIGERAGGDVQQLMTLLGNVALARSNGGIHAGAALPFMLHALQPEWAVWQQAYFEPSPDTSFELYTTTFCDNQHYSNARTVQAIIKGESQTTSASLLEIDETVIAADTTLRPRYDALLVYSHCYFTNRGEIPNIIKGAYSPNELGEVLTLLEQSCPNADIEGLPARNKVIESLRRYGLAARASQRLSHEVGRDPAEPSLAIVAAIQRAVANLR